MVEAHQRGTLPGVAGDLVTQSRTATTTVAEIAESTGVPVQSVLRALVAAGIPAQPDTALPGDLGSVMAAFEQGAAILGEEAVLAFTRVLGAAANNIAEAAIALFFAELGPGTVREGPDELARARLAEAATTAFTSVPEVLGDLVMDAFERAQRRAESARSWSGPIPSDAEGPSEVVALGFVDLVGSTAWAQSTSLRVQNLALTRFESAAWTSAVLAGGRVIKMIGDEVFFAAPTAEAGCRIAVEVCRAAAEDEVLPPGPRGGGHRPRDAPGGRLLRAAREPAQPARQDRRPRRGRGDRGGGVGPAARRVVAAPAGAGRLTGHPRTRAGLRRRTPPRGAPLGPQARRRHKTYRTCARRHLPDRPLGTDRSSR